ncbi:SDR family NAD(P)-dependent oxidoreductase [Phenylobacterium sp.]|uniref:SDR family NAD(P)-dependent oxidoreductase n=1 Tax=Phenylobacterium sp. TaxID=1871053 RepID=UPI002E2F6523|nr:SDR family NAD(P)-dependent oxidoreductase [Phenylobacterium sp.]HEX2560520.1 SDR family NAD(P)-dependent oxidoreductase [Phenylobacterium sp.]
MAGRLAGKVCIITGASRGLGQYCAVGYGREGAKVVVAARTENVTDERLPGTIYDTARLVEEAGGEALPLVCNVADMESVEQMVEQVLAKWGRIDVLMTNAAVQPAGFISTIKPKSWELEFNINVHGPFRCIRAALPAMQAQKSGSIINISSIAATGGSHYGATKRAIESMTIGLARELKDQGIAVNAMKPVGAIETPGLLFGRPQSQRPGGQARPELPRPDSYVEAAIILAAATPEAITGQVLNDAQIVERYAQPELKDRFRAENPQNWVAAMTA